MTDAVLVAARELATEAFTDLRAVVDGLDSHPRHPFDAQHPLLGPRRDGPPPP